MPVPILAEVISNGLPGDVNYWNVMKLVAAVAVLVAIKLYCGGATNRSLRQMNSKIIMISGGTTGIGAATAYNLAKLGAQIILLTQHEPADPFLVDYIEHLRTRTGNELIYAEQVDLASTHSIRKFATKWIDNIPPRRLDMIILCGATFTPPGKKRTVTSEGVEETWMVNYMSNYHLLSILSPAIRAQPPDRHVRIIFATCPAYSASPPLFSGTEAAMNVKIWSPAKAYARSKLALMVFGMAFQKHLDAYKRPDGAPNNARVVFVDPGYTRTPGMRRYLSRGTLWGLALYLALWHGAWLFLKSPVQGSQSFLYAAMEASVGRGAGGKLIRECREAKIARTDVTDEKGQKTLWEGTEKFIERVEREEAVKKALLKEADSPGKKAAKGRAKTAKAEKSKPEAIGRGTEEKKSRSRRSR